MPILHSSQRMLADNCKTDISVCPRTAAILIMEQFIHTIGVVIGIEQPDFYAVFDTDSDTDPDNRAKFRIAGANP